jgi:hypothetical protein
VEAGTDRHEGIGTLLIWLTVGFSLGGPSKTLLIAVACSKSHPEPAETTDYTDYTDSTTLHLN